MKDIKGLSENSQRAYLRDLKKFSDYIAKKDCSTYRQITSDICSEWLGQLFADNLSAKSIQRHVSSGKGFFNFLKQNSLIDSSPFNDVAAPKAPKNLPEVLSPDQVNNLLSFPAKKPQDFRDLAILELIYSAIDELNAGNGDISVNKEESTPLFGAASVLDSVDLVNLLLSVEELLEDELDIEFVIANEKALSQKNSPFKTVATLAQYLTEEINSL